MLDAADFAYQIGMPLVAHACIQWNGTGCFDDPDGKRFAKVREGLSKALGRRGIRFAAVWARERSDKGSSPTEHAHLVFHLPDEWRQGERRAEIIAILERLIDRHGGGLYGDWTLKLTHHTNGDVRYLLKGGTPEVWRDHKVKRKWRRSQGLIHGKRCGTTENIGPAARRRWRETTTATSP